MTYLEQIDKCKTLDALFSVWSKKEEMVQRVVYSGETHYLKINYKENGFISDGIVNKKAWAKMDFPKVLFVMKSFDGKDAVGDFDIRPRMRKEEFLGSSLLEIQQWVEGLLLTNEKEIRPYRGADIEKCWEKIAVIFLKKENAADGDKSCNPDIIDIHTKNNRVEIAKEIELINPDVIVCCSTFRSLMTYVYGEDVEQMIRDKKLAHWYCLIPVKGRGRLFIDYFEPGFPDLIAYYGIVNIYQQALINEAAFLRGDYQ